jgi:PhoH-like ATPase
LFDPKALLVFDDNEVIIPIVVLDELDDAKVRPDEVGRNARSIVRMLDELRSKGSLSEGVKLNNSIIRVELNHSNNIPNGLSIDKKDNRIISVSIGLKKDNPLDSIIVVTKDINMRVKCDALGIEAQDYNKDKIATDLESIYSGVQTLDVSSNLINALYEDGFTIIEDLKSYPNQFFILKSGSQSALTCYKKDKLELCRTQKEVWGITPRNVEQKMALNLLLDPNIKLVTLIGKAGSGKTLLACASALHQVLNSSKMFQRILISRPIQPMGRDLGYLPGSVDEKLAPWMQPIYDNLEFLLGADFQMLNEYKYSGLIHVEPITYIRGRSIPQSFLLVDEAQNLTVQEIKTIITRMGEGSKIVLTGDIEQIDNTYVDFADNGLTHIVERFKDYAIAGHVTLRKGERSELATLASNIL